MCQGCDAALPVLNIRALANSPHITYHERFVYGAPYMLLAWYAATILLSAGLLFCIEPMVAKMALPLLGGSPSVWNTCMLWFQAMLLAGYAYAHLAPRRVGLKRHAIIHVGIIVIPLLVLPLDIRWASPPTEGNPSAWLLALLTVAVGPAFFALATTAPLLQRWFASTTHRSADDPYFLYAASNAGSLGALAAYPLLLEPHLKLTEQTHLWTVGYVVFIMLMAGCAVLLRRSADHGQTDAVAETSVPASGATKLRWLLWSFIPSSLMLGVTNYVTTDVAPVPLLWVMPLGLYLLTFIQAFSRLRSPAHPVAVCLLPVGIAALLIAGIFDYDLSILQQILLHLAVFYVAALVCHGELASARPPARQLTEYYLIIALGGVLGGVFNAILAPLLFNRIVEYPLVIVLIGFLRPRLHHGSSSSAADSSEAAGDIVFLGWMLFGVAGGILFYFLSYHGDWSPESLWHIERNFFGVVSVRRDPQVNCLNLLHGTTVHGVRSLSPGHADEPLAYYSRTGPIGQVFQCRADLESVGVIGLGAGSLAAYAHPGQQWTFYEIDPAVVRIAENPSWFSFLSGERPGRVSLVLGDGRLRLARSAERYDLLVVDAFSSDAIPVHLLTREALGAYFDHLKPGGWLAFHLSSEYLELAPLIAALAADRHLAGLYQENFDLTPVDFRAGKLGSQWAVLARSDADLVALVRSKRWVPLDSFRRVTAWTDDYSNILSILRKRQSPSGSSERPRR
jgi:hypothetical protein